MDFKSLKEDKPKAMLLALAVVQGLVLIGWGISTWISLHPPPTLPAKPPALPGARGPLAFLNPIEPNSFNASGRGPFFAPAIDIRDKPAVAITPRTNRTIWPQRPVTTNTTATTAPTGPTIMNVELVYRGTMVDEKGEPLALIEDKISGKQKFVKIGDEVQGCSVTDIANNVVRLDKGGTVFAVKLGQSEVVGQIQQ